MLASRGLARALRQAVAPLRAAPIARRRVTTCASGAKAGDHVKVQYTGTLDDGTVFDSNVDRDPLEFIIGGGQVIKGFDTAVTGLEVGGSRKARIPPEEAYGVRDSKLEMSFPADAAPKGLEVGMQVQLSNGRVASVIRMDPIDGFTLDLNHELAGKSLTFDVKLLVLTAAEKIKKATFGMGCFWGPELHYQRVPGVISTEVGYTNGSVDDPTYEQVCSGNTGHAEVVQVLYNPDEVSYDELLDVFWDRHDPTTLNRQGNDQGTQYRSGIYYHDDEQKEIATKSIEKAKARFKAPIVSELKQISKYYPAEPYHQQYLARGGRNGSAQNPTKGCNDPVRCYG